MKKIRELKKVQFPIIGSWVREQMMKISKILGVLCIIIHFGFTMISTYVYIREDGLWTRCIFSSLWSFKLVNNEDFFILIILMLNLKLHKQHMMYKNMNQNIVYNLKPQNCSKPQNIKTLEKTSFGRFPWNFSMLLYITFL